MTIQEWIEACDVDLNAEFPIDFKDPTVDDVPLINQYNAYLVAGDYESARNYRIEHPELDAFINDAYKMNLLQAFAINAYKYVTENASYIKDVTELPTTSKVGTLYIIKNKKEV